MLQRLLNILRRRRFGLSSSPLVEGSIETRLNGEKVDLAHSTFNPAWLGELGITPGVILALGSFDGGDSLRLARAFPDCRVLSVEADPDRFAVALRNLADSGVELINLAVAEVDGPVDWYPSTVEGEAHAQGSIFRHSDRYKKKFPFVSQVAKPQSIKGQRLDSLCTDKAIDGVDFLHMDIEGAEFSALQSMGEMRPKVIFLEMRDHLFVDAPGSAKTDGLLRRLGYDLVLHLGTDRLYAHQSVRQA